MKDLVYYFDKETFIKYELGEIQREFSQSFVIDGTKDSAKIQVISYSEIKLTPNTILWHENTNTWWIVAKDKVEKYINESGFVYKHDITLDGAIELLNARDLTDHGYYQNRYTIRSFVERLFRMSTFEFKDSLNIDTGSGNFHSIDLDRNVDYIKTFENYTLLSALREFFDGYNCAIKLTFEIGEDSDNNELLTGANFIVISKSGDMRYGVINTATSNPFNDVRELESVDKNSYGTTVISNAENVVSSITKTYPTTGYARLTGTTATLSPSNSRLRLPSNIFKVNWLRLCLEATFNINIYEYHGTSQVELDFNGRYKQGNDSNNKEYWESLLSEIENKGFTHEQEILAYFEQIKPMFTDILDKATRITLYNNDRYDPLTQKFVNPVDPKEYYAPVIRKYYGLAPDTYLGKLVLCPKDLRDTLDSSRKFGAISWERGRDYIENFECLSTEDDQDHTRLYNGYQDTDLRNSQTYDFDTIIGTGSEQAHITITFGDIKTRDLRFNNTFFQINYVPMTDIKVKYDNGKVNLDSNMYNQNGKLNDSNSVSKLIHSHSKEIENPTLTRFGTYYNINPLFMPRVGQIVVDSGSSYVINNVSYEFHPNEDGYKVIAQFTMSLNVSTKSVLTSPNTNIRDYGIPQNYNVKRKQLYRDYYELTHTRESTNYTWYLPIEKVFNVSPNVKTYQEHIAIMKIEYDNAYGGNIQEGGSTNPNDTWYYQLNTTTYVLKKSIYEIVEFKDNNIIGYGVLNVSSGFDIGKLFDGLRDLVNTPVSYVDDNGCFKSISICMCTNEQTTDIYERYCEYMQTTNDNLYNSTPFIGADIYEGWGTTPLYPVDTQGAVVRNDFKIIETDYYKDSVEVPVFEYSCQLGDSDDVEFGEDILKSTPSDMGYIFQAHLIPIGYVNQNSYLSQFSSGDIQVRENVETNEYNVDNPNMNSYREIANACKIEIVSNEIIISLYDTMKVDSDGTIEYGTLQPISTGGSFVNRELVIYRVPLNNEIVLEGTTSYADISSMPVELFMIVKNLQNAVVDENGKLHLQINYYKTH